jgi:hypothetical protein
MGKQGCALFLYLVAGLVAVIFVPFGIGPALLLVGWAYRLWKAGENE